MAAAAVAAAAMWQRQVPKNIEIETIESWTFIEADGVAGKPRSRFFRRKRAAAARRAA